MLWPDVFRGFVICTIVYYHAVYFLSWQGFVAHASISTIQFYQAIGMAIFFAISGMHTRRHIDASWRDCWRERLGPLLWMLVLWSTVDWCLFALFPNRAHPDHGRSLWEIPLAWLLPVSYLWFLWSLAAYLVAARLFARLRPVWGLGTGLLLALVFAGLSDWHLRRYGLGIMADHFTWRAALSYFLFYFIGYRYRDQLIATGRWPLLPAFLVANLIGHALAWFAPFAHSALVSAPMLVASLLVGLVGAVQFARVLALLPATSRLFAGLGRITLPIYLMHLMVLVPLVFAAATLDWPAFHRRPALLALGIAAVSLASSLGIAAIFGRLGWEWPFRPPHLLFRGRDIVPRTSREDILDALPEDQRPRSSQG